jgi:hypothetical protein
VSCPRCKAAPGELCRGRNGQELQWRHKGRPEDAAVAAAPVTAAASKPKPGPSTSRTETQPITYHELAGQEIWHAKRGKTYLAYIIYNKKTGQFGISAGGRSYEPQPTLETARAICEQVLQGASGSAFVKEGTE